MESPTGPSQAPGNPHRRGRACPVPLFGQPGSSGRATTRVAPTGPSQAPGNPYRGGRACPVPLFGQPGSSGAGDHIYGPPRVCNGARLCRVEVSVAHIYTAFRRETSCSLAPMDSARALLNKGTASKAYVVRQGLGASVQPVLHLAQHRIAQPGAAVAACPRSVPAVPAPPVRTTPDGTPDAAQLPRRGGGVSRR